MWNTTRRLRVDPELRQAAQELMEDTARNLIIMTTVAYVALQFVVTAASPDDRAPMTIWYMMPIMVGTTFLSMRWLYDRFVLSQITWQTGLAITITVAILAFGMQEIALLYVVLPFMAVIIAGPTAGGMSELLVLVVCVALRLARPDLISGGMAWSVMGGSIFASAVAWVASRTLFTVTQWSLQSFERARQQTAAARQHRAQLALALNDLDRAYYRLERTNSALVVAWQAAAEAERFKAEFATNLSHELRTPLNLIIGFCEMMMTAPQKYQGEMMPRAYRADLNAIFSNAQHLMALVNDVIDLSRIDVGKLALVRERVDMRSLVDEVVAMVKEYVTAKGLALDVQVEDGLPLLTLDRLRVKQVLLNLMINAVRFTEEGALIVSVAGEGSHLMVRVADTGRGIPADQVASIFDQFGQVGDQTAGGWMASSGLGLPISKRFVELHGGNMGVESVFGVGTTFWFTLPCQAGEVPPHEVADGGLMRTLPKRPAIAEEQLIVVVHDDARAARRLQRELPNMRIVHAADMDEGVRLAAELQAAGLVAEEPVAPEGLGSDTLYVSCLLPSSRHVAHELGASDFMVKPIQEEQLWQAIGQVEEALGYPVQRVLIADDDVDMVRLIRRMLVPQIEQRHCVEAHSGPEALAILADQSTNMRPIDLLLLDWMMPHDSGRETLAVLRANPDLQDLPVIIVSGREPHEIVPTPHVPVSLSKSTPWRLGQIAEVIGSNLAVLHPERDSASSRAGELEATSAR